MTDTQNGHKLLCRVGLLDFVTQKCVKIFLSNKICQDFLVKLNLSRFSFRYTQHKTFIN